MVSTPVSQSEYQPWRWNRVLETPISPPPKKALGIIPVDAGLCRDQEVQQRSPQETLSGDCSSVHVKALLCFKGVFPKTRWVKNPPQCRRNRSRGFDPWVRKIPWRRKWPPTPVFLPEKSHGQKSLESYSPWGRKESDTTEWLSTYFNNLCDHTFAY